MSTEYSEDFFQLRYSMRILGIVVVGQLLPDIPSADPQDCMDDLCKIESKRKLNRIICRGCGKILNEPDAKRRKISWEEDNTDSTDDDWYTSVFTMGAGDVGQLGLGPGEMVQEVPTIVSNLPRDIMQVVAGGMHSICLTDDGQVFSFGINDEGTLGRRTEEEEDCFLPFPVEISPTFIQVSAGDSHTAAVTDDGRVFIWGTFRDPEGNQFLIHGGPAQSVDPVEVMHDIPVVKVSSGTDHIVCLTVRGEIYSFGRNDQGQLGRTLQDSIDEENQFADRSFNGMLLEPDQVLFSEEQLTFRNIWAGYHSTFAKTSTGDIYAWGLNNFYQLGVGDMITRPLPEKWPEMVDDFECMDIAVGEHHTLALDSTGRVYSVGRGDYGQLGIGRLSPDTEQLRETFVLIPKLQDKECVSISCGTSVSFAVTKNGTVYGWGMGSGQLGLGDLGNDDIFVPTPVGGALRTRKVLSVSSGGQHTVILSEEHMSKEWCDVDGHISRI